MNGFSLFKNQTAVLALLCSALTAVPSKPLAAGIGDTDLFDIFTRAHGGPKYTPAQVAAIKAEICGRENDAEGKKRCEANVTAQLYGVDLPGSSETRCANWMEKYTKAFEKYSQACTNVGASPGSETGAPKTKRKSGTASNAEKLECQQMANQCSTAMLPQMSEDEDDTSDPEDEEDLISDCRKVAQSCPVIGAVKQSAAKKDFEDAKENYDDSQEKYVSAQEKIQRLQEEMMDSQNEQLQSQVRMQAANAEANRKLESALMAADQEKVAKTQALREGFAKIDEEYVKLRSQLEQANAAINEERDKIEETCEKQADTFWQALQTAKRTKKATGTNNQRSATRLAGAEKRRNLEYQKELKACQTKKSTRSRQARLEERRTVALKSAMDVQVLLETRRATMIQNLQEAEVLAEAAKNKAAADMQARLREQQSAAAQEMQANMGRQAQKSQEMMMLSGRVQEADGDLRQSMRERKVADFARKCANVAAKAGGLGPSDEDENDAQKTWQVFKNASTYHIEATSACRIAIEACKNTDTQFKCMGYPQAAADTGPARPASGGSADSGP